MEQKLVPVSAVVDQDRETIDVTAVANSDGVAFEESRQTVSVELINLAGETPIEYRVDDGDWTLLSASGTVELDINLSQSTVRVRRAGRIDVPARAQIFFDLGPLDEFTADGLPVEIGSGGPGGAVSSVNGKTGTVVLRKSDFGLDAVDNTPDAEKPVSNPQRAAIDAASGGAIRSVAAQTRIYALSQTPPGTFTWHLSREAPFEYDGVRLIAYGPSNSALGGDGSATDTIKASVNAPAAIVNGNPQDSAGQPLALVPVTWGAPDTNDARSIGGQATTTITNAVPPLREGYVISDFIPLESVARSDSPGSPPMICTRFYGPGVGVMNDTNSGVNAPNPYSSSIPGFLSGYLGGDQTANPSAGMPGSDWLPAVGIIFYRRAGGALAIAIAGDSIGQGWVEDSVVPKWGGLIGGWPLKLVKMLTDAGKPASLSNNALTGRKSDVFHEAAYSAIVIGGLSHIFLQPWSVNEMGDGIASTTRAIQRMTVLLDLARRHRVIPIVVRPWAGQGVDSAPGVAIQDYCDACAAHGVIVFDATSIVGNGNAIFPQYLTRDSNGNVVANVHLNEAGHDAVAAFAYAHREQLALI